MSLQDGALAISLAFSDRVPRTEYSADMHWPLVARVTGIEVGPHSPQLVRDEASAAFRKAWNYDFVWNILTHNQIFNGFFTSMGHASYTDGGTDFSDDVYCPFDDPEDVLAFDAQEHFGSLDKQKLIVEYNGDIASQKSLTPDAVTMTGIYVTMVSGLLELFGWDMLLMAAGMDSAGFGQVANRYAGWIQQYFDALAETDGDVVMIHDDIVWTNGAFIHPDWYRAYIFPNYKKLFAPLIAKGKKIIYTSDGNYTAFIDDIAQCGVSGFVMEPCTDMVAVSERYGNTHVFIGNADTRILQSGTKDDIYREVKRCMDIGKQYPGYFMAVGNHIPVSVPVENALWYNEYYEKLSIR